MTIGLLVIASSRGLAAVYVSPITLLVCILVVPGVVALAVVSHVYRKEEEEEEEADEADGETRRMSTMQWYAERFVPCALESAVLDSIPLRPFSSATMEAEMSGCVVCLTPFQAQELLTVLPPCHHTFHVACIHSWFESHSTCPICRCQVSTPVALHADQDVCLDVVTN